MPDDSWNPKGLNIPLRRPVEIFVPNVNAIDMDTTGTWPFGRRLEDQVATRFLSVFLDMNAEFNGKKYHVEILNDQAVWDAAADRAEDAAQSAEERQGVSQALSLSGGAMVTAKTDYQSDLERIEKSIAELRDHALVPPTDTEKVTRYVHSVYQHAVHTGNLAQLEAVEPVIDEGIRQIRFPGDLYFLKANLAFKLHRLDDVRRNLGADPSLLSGAASQSLAGRPRFSGGPIRAGKGRIPATSSTAIERGTISRGWPTSKPRWAMPTSPIGFSPRPRTN